MSGLPPINPHVARWEVRYRTRRRGRVVRTTLGQLVEAIAAVTDDVTEMRLVVEHILRSRATRDRAPQGRAWWKP